MVSNYNITVYDGIERIGFIQDFEVDTNLKNISITRMAIYTGKYPKVNSNYLPLNIFYFLRGSKRPLMIIKEYYNTGKLEIYSDCIMEIYGTSYTASSITVGQDIKLKYSTLKTN